MTEKGNSHKAESSAWRQLLLRPGPPDRIQTTPSHHKMVGLNGWLDAEMAQWVGGQMVGCSDELVNV